MISPSHWSLSACPTGYYGQSCSFYCSGNAEDFCRGLLICLPDPYGCSCYSGWYGTRCNLSKSIFDSLIDGLVTLQVVLSIVMDRIVPINVPVTTVIDSQVSVIVMELNVIRVNFFSSDQHRSNIHREDRPRHRRWKRGLQPLNFWKILLADRFLPAKTHVKVDWAPKIDKVTWAPPTQKSFRRPCSKTFIYSYIDMFILDIPE